MYLIPFIRTSRAIVLTNILQINPLITISASEIISYTFPIVYESKNIEKSCDNLLLFSLYIFFYYESSIFIIEEYKDKYKIFYQLEALCILIYFLNNFIN